MKRRRRLVYGVIALGALAFAASFVTLAREHGRPDGRSSTSGATEATPLQVRVAAAAVGPMARVLELPGTIEATRVARLASPAEGPVAALSVREGDSVRAGERVVRIGRHRATAARLSSQREDLRNAEEELVRVKRLVDTGAVAGEALDQARAGHERAVAQAEAGEESVGDHDVRAPWTGVVSHVLVQDGNYVAPRTPLVEIFDPTSLVVRVAVPEAFAMRVSHGSGARVSLDAHAGLELRARVSRVYPELDRRLRTRTVELVLEAPPPLAPGMFARVRLAVERDEVAIVIPAEAIVTSADGSRAVFVVAGDRAQRRPVVLGIEDGSRLQVRSGVRAGELVAVSGQPKLRDGAAVRVKAEPPPGATPTAARSTRP